MKALVTAGGTKIPIDDVRYIGNFSKGKFGAQIVRSLFWHCIHKPNDQIHHLVAEGAEVPESPRPRYYKDTFVTYDDYYDKIKKFIKCMPVDIVFLAAAVSDYGLKKKAGKIDSKGPLTLEFDRLPKIISELKDWALRSRGGDFIQVGFKLTSGLKPEETIEIAKTKGVQTYSDFTIANDMSNLSLKYVIDHRRNFEDMRTFEIKTQQDVHDLVGHILDRTGIE